MRKLIITLMMVLLLNIPALADTYSFGDKHNPFASYEKNEVAFSTDSIQYISIVFSEVIQRDANGKSLKGGIWNGSEKATMGIITIRAANADVTGQIYQYIQDQVNKYHSNWDPGTPLLQPYDNALVIRPQVKFNANQGKSGTIWYAQIRTEFYDKAVFDTLINNLDLWNEANNLGLVKKERFIDWLNYDIKYWKRQ